MLLTYTELPRDRSKNQIHTHLPTEPAYYKQPPNPPSDRRSLPLVSNTLLQPAPAADRRIVPGSQGHEDGHKSRILAVCGVRSLRVCHLNMVRFGKIPEETRNVIHLSDVGMGVI